VKNEAEVIGGGGSGRVGNSDGGGEGVRNKPVSYVKWRMFSRKEPGDIRVKRRRRGEGEVGSKGGLRGDRTRERR